ncbi:MAG TPA: hypothetical protein VGG25_10285 [Streptosporangiaceae bacterium]|jgi:hypothetical protein
MPEISDTDLAELEQLRAEAAARAAEPPAPAAAPADQLTPAEIAEFRKLRADAQMRASRDREARKVAELKRSGPTHRVHLADGTVMQASGGTIATHDTTGDGTGDPAGDHVIAVAGAWLLSEAERLLADRKRLAALEDAAEIATEVIAHV